MSLTDNYKNLIKNIPNNVLLVAVSKTHPVEEIQTIYDAGQRVFGENKVQELIPKYEALPKDIIWHLIGHLQTNKVKYIAPFIHVIESVDSEKLLQEIDKQALKNKRKINILLQIKIAEEDSKTGMDIDEAKELFQKYLDGEFPNVEIDGLMGIGTLTENEELTRKEFTFLHQQFDQFCKLKKLKFLSMGMSHDYKIAIDCGANSVRIGSSIFGNRNYA